MKLGHRLRREVLRVPRQVDRMSVASAVHTSGLTLLRSSNLVECPFISLTERVSPVMTLTNTNRAITSPTPLKPVALRARGLWA